MTDYNSNTVPQLKELLKERGLSTDGKKADLVSRLSENDGAKQPEESQPEAVADNGETAAEPVAEETGETPVEGSGAEADTKPEEPEEPKEEKKVLSPEERKQLAVDLLTKKIQRAEKFGDESSAEAARKDLARIEKFGVEPGTALAREIGLVDKSFNKGLQLFKKKPFKRNFKKSNFKPKFNKFRRKY